MSRDRVDATVPHRLSPTQRGGGVPRLFRRARSPDSEPQTFGLTSGSGGASPQERPGHAGKDVASMESVSELGARPRSTSCEAVVDSNRSRRCASVRLFDRFVRDVDGGARHAIDLSRRRAAGAR